MNTFFRILFIGVLALVLVPNISNAQNKREKEKESRTAVTTDDRKIDQDGAVVEGYVFIKAVEQDFGKFDIRINAGIDKEGGERRIVSNGKEEERFNRVLETRSLVNLLSFMQRMGYHIETSYALANKDEIVHYYLMNNNSKSGMNADEMQTSDQMMEQRRANQNRPKLSPEEIEKRKRARQEAQDR
ncbi:MAG: hypothetical protein K9H64_03420 [Bacteroidales bacterium]|nr:hypothetical protein [Bacteroidales bacterium]MCF8456445.1 hypothetical protein [Bacteroidales bacterium]